MIVPKWFENFAKSTDCSGIPTVSYNYYPNDLSNFYINKYKKLIRRWNKVGLGIALFGVILSISEILQGNGYGFLVLSLIMLVLIHICVNVCMQLLGSKRVIKSLSVGKFSYMDSVVIKHSFEDYYSYDNDRTTSYYSGKKRFIQFNGTDLVFETDLLNLYPVGTEVVLLIVNKKLARGTYCDTIIEVFKKV